MDLKFESAENNNDRPAPAESEILFKPSTSTSDDDNDSIECSTFVDEKFLDELDTSPCKKADKEDRKNDYSTSKIEMHQLGIPLDKYTVLKEEAENVAGDHESERFQLREGVQGDPLEFLQTLRNQFGTAEEFTQFERHYYSQHEELKMLREKFSSARLMLMKTGEEKRVLEHQLLSERALRDQNSKNSEAYLEYSRFQQNSQIYSIRCQMETWKRKSEGSQTEILWLKEQMKHLEMEKLEALRRFSDLNQQLGAAEEYRASCDAYANRQRETMQQVQSGLVHLENARASLETLTEQNQIKMKFLMAYLKSDENTKKTMDNRIKELEQELVKAKAELVQNKAELHRTQTSEARKTELATKLISENRDLHCGIKVLTSSLDSTLGQSNQDFIRSIGKTRENVKQIVKKLGIETDPPHLN